VSGSTLLDRSFFPLVVLTAVLLTAPAGPAYAANGVILNTLQGLDDRERGLSGGLDGLFSGSGGNTERIILAATTRVQWRGARNRWQLRGGWGYEESGSRTTARNVTAHLRHNYDIVTALATVAFVQAQENPFQRIESRWLLGLGLRADLVDDDSGSVRVGVTPMVEVQRIEGDPERSERGRLSTFAFVERRPHERIRIDGTGFYQPLFADGRDYRTAFTLTAAVNLAGSLDLKVGGSVETSSRPAPTVERTDWSTFTSLSVRL
jgi:hypothetical protein